MHVWALSTIEKENRIDAQDFHMLLFGTDTHVEKKCAASASSDQICLFDIAISTSNEIAIFRVRAWQHEYVEYVKLLQIF